MISKARASITRMNLFRTTEGIFELLFAREHFPSLVIQILVALGTGLPSEM